MILRVQTLLQETLQSSGYNLLIIVSVENEGNNCDTADGKDARDNECGGRVRGRRTQINIVREM